MAGMDSGVCSVTDSLFGAAPAAGLSDANGRHRIGPVAHSCLAFPFPFRAGSVYGVGCGRVLGEGQWSRINGHERRATTRRRFASATEALFHVFPCSPYR